MNNGAYQAKLNELRDSTRTNLFDLSVWVRNVAMPWIWVEMAGAILPPRVRHPSARQAPAPLHLLPCTASEAVRHGLMVSASDMNSMASKPSYYRAQLTMLDSEALRYCDRIDQLASESAVENTVVHTLHSALWEMMSYGYILLEEAGSCVTKVPGYYAARRARRERPFEVYKGAEKIIYGTYSGLTHRDRAPYTPVAVLRTAVELRIRHAFGVSSYVHPDRPDELIPLDMSKLFEAIRTKQSEIHFEVDLHDVWKVYRWSNFYLHSGVRDFPWVPGFLLQYLRPFFCGVPAQSGKGWSMNSGIRMKREAWRAVRKCLEPKKEVRRFSERIGSAWRALFPASKRLAELPTFDEEHAQCVFLD